MRIRKMGPHKFWAEKGPVSASGQTRKEAKRNLKRKITRLEWEKERKSAP